jgi:uncharacterized protein (DUF4415 family)
MSKTSTSETWDDPDDYPEITQADLDRAVLRINGRPVTPARKRRITILLDEALIEHFKALAGERGYQTLINETLRRAVQQEDLELRLRRVIREEMAQYKTAGSEE